MSINSITETPVQVLNLISDFAGDKNIKTAVRQLQISEYEGVAGDATASAAQRAFSDKMAESVKLLDLYEENMRLSEGLKNDAVKQQRWADRFRLNARVLLIKQENLESVLASRYGHNTPKENSKIFKELHLKIDALRSEVRINVEQMHEALDAVKGALRASAKAESIAHEVLIAAMALKEAAFQIGL
ncbi:MAG: hypothetical protein COT84_08550 [Chlamydiae bacterium CG10_big_fil_rev_8_21_14_0_10_35_9]|nr:MAG: hypothetical protein COT84_08550 [Chlamydiae bacterium CG10_big_fil_rev_8_21_14_0_10_35_9]